LIQSQAAIIKPIMLAWINGVGVIDRMTKSKT